MSDNKVKVTMCLNDLCGNEKGIQYDNITESDAKNCVKQLDSYNKIPKNRCIAAISMLYNQQQDMLATITENDKWHLRETYCGKLSISVLLQKNCICNFKDCCANIGTQRCFNSFANKILYEELFKNKREQR